MAFCNRLLEINGKLSTLRMLATTELRYEVNSSFCLKVLIVALLTVLCLMELIFRKVPWELALPVFIEIKVVYWFVLIYSWAWIFSYGCHSFLFALIRVLAMPIFTFLVFCFGDRWFPYKKCFVFSMYFVSWIDCAVFCDFFSQWSSGDWFCQREPDFTFFAWNVSFYTLNSCLNQLIWRHVRIMSVGMLLEIVVVGVISIIFWIFFTTFTTRSAFLSFNLALYWSFAF